MPPQKLSHYTILEKLGAGGMGVVYRAHDEQLDRDVAIKVLPTGMLANESARRRFRREALALAKLNHPNIEAIYEFDTDDGVDFLVMELLSGVTLDAKLAAGPLPEIDVLRLGIQLAEGLEAAHSQGVIHRDLKPGNLRLTKEGRLKIMDFGLAQWAQAEGEAALTATLTKSEEISGTVPYMAPEQLRGQPADVRTDIYSAGAVLYEMATGKHLFPDTSGPQLIGAILERPPSPPSSHNRRISPGLESIVLKALDKDPNRRYQSAKELAVDLERLSTGAAPLSHRRRPPWVWAVAVVGALAIVFFVGFQIALHRRAVAASSTIKARRSVAVLGFKNLSAKPDDAWISTALSEMLTSELAAGEQVRAIPGENVARMKLDLTIPDADGFSRDTLTRIRQRLGSDFIVLGSFVETGGQLRLDSRLQDAIAGETLASVTEQGSEAELLDLVSRTGARLRTKLGIGEVPAAESSSVRAALPSNSDAARLYSEGLAKLRVFEILPARDLLENAVAADPNHALAHSALAAAWAGLGYDAKAQDEAKKAFDLSANLPRANRLSIEGGYHEIAHDWAKAAETYRTLWEFFPDSVDYGLRFANAQSSSGHAKDGLATIAALRKLPPPSGDDPRIDLAEATAADWLGDLRSEAAAAERVVEKAKAQGARVLIARARLSEGGALGDLGEAAKAMQALDESRQIYSEVRDQQGVARALNSIGIIHRHQGNFDEAQKALEQSLEISKKIGNKLGTMQALNNLANTLSDQGKLANAEGAYQETLKLSREIGDKGLESIALGNLGGVLTIEGKLAAAKQKYEESLKLARAVGDRDSEARTLGNIADLLNRKGELAAARKTLEEALAIDREIGDKSLIGYATNALGSILAAQGDLAAARQQQETSLSVRQEIGEKVTAAETRFALAELLLEQGDFAKAEPEARQIAAIFHEESVTDDEAQSCSLLARTLLLQGKISEAQQAIKQANAILSKAQDPTTRITVQIASAQVAAADNPASDSHLSSLSGARRSLNTALAESRKYGYRDLEFEARLALGEIEMKSGNRDASRATLRTLERDARAKGFLLVARKAAKTRS